MTLSEIEDEVKQIVGRWRSQTPTEQRNNLSYLDDLLGELDDVDTGSAGTTAEMVDHLRGRIEILMDEIEISLGIEPPPITGLTDIDAKTETDLHGYEGEQGGANSILPDDASSVGSSG